MFTEIDKAISAGVMALLSILTISFGWHFGGISEETIVAIVAALTPFIVWYIPNKKQSAAA